MKRKVLIAAGALVVVLVATQLVPVDRSNPSVAADFDGPSEVATVLRASCYDCHSHETTWPWYSRVAPVSWLIAHDVEEARGHLLDAFGEGRVGGALDGAAPLVQTIHVASTRIDEHD